MAIYGPEKPASKPFNGMIRTDLSRVQSLSPTVADDFVRAHGVTCELWEAVPCPCVSRERTVPVADCVTCHGRGDFHPEDRRLETVALLTGRSADRKREAYGEEVSGRISVTLPAGVVWRKGWLVLPKDEVHIVTEYVTRAGRLTDTSRIAARLTDDIAEPLDIQNRPEKLVYPKVSRIRDIYWGGGDTTAVRATEGVDYELAVGAVRWLNDRGPSAGAVYTVVYEAPAAYLLDDPKQRREGETKLPPYAMAMRLDSATPQRMGG